MLPLLCLFFFLRIVRNILFFAFDPVFPRGPLAQIDQPAPLGTERPERVVVPFRFFFTDRACDFYFFHHSGPRQPCCRDCGPRQPCCRVLRRHTLHSRFARPAFALRTPRRWAQAVDLVHTVGSLHVISIHIPGALRAIPAHTAWERHGTRY